MTRRMKLSTTIGPVNFAYLHRLVKAGKAASVGEAVDQSIEIARRLDSRLRLEIATAAYFDQMSVEAGAEESVLSGALSDAAREMNFDQP